MHVAPFWEIIYSWIKGPMKHVTDKTKFQEVCPSVIKYVRKFKAYPLFKDICMHDKASMAYW